MNSKNFWVCLLMLSVCMIGFKTEASAEAPGRCKNKWAVLIGTNEFSDSRWAYKYAESDVSKFRHYLLEKADFHPKNVRYLTGGSATKASVEKALFEWLPSVAGKDDMVVIYIRSHATYSPRYSTVPSYVIFSDTKLDSLSKTGIDSSTLPRAIIEKVHALSTTMIFDTDFGGNYTLRCDFTDDVSFGNSKFTGNFIWNLMSSTAPNQIAWECDEYTGSIFTHRLLESISTSKNSIDFFTAAGTCSENVESDAKKFANRHQSIDVENMSHIGGIESVSTY